MRQLIFYFDLSCPYAWMGLHRVRPLAQRYGLELVYRPVLLGGLYQHHDSPQVPAQSWSQERQDMLALDLKRQSEGLGLKMNPPPGHPHRTVQALRLILCTPEPRWPELTAALYAAYWEQGLDLSQPSVLEPIAGRFGVDLGATQDPKIKAELRARTQEASARGVFGVPSFALEDDSGLFYWGQDRLRLLQAKLSERETYQSTPRSLSPDAPVLRWYYDFSSPYGYLSSLCINELAASAGFRVQPVPFLLGALFQRIGTPMIPLATFSPAKQRYVAQDLKQWAAWWGGEFNFASTFPLRTILPLRVALQEEAAIAPLYRAAWVQDRDIGQPQIVHAVLSEAGLDADRLISGAQDPLIKERLKENTAHAQRLGVPGVPTFELPDGRLFWGQDRMEELERTLTELQH